jgi:hypothetical protein
VAFLSVVVDSIVASPWTQAFEACLINLIPLYRLGVVGRPTRWVSALAPTAVRANQTDAFVVFR